MQVGFDYDDRFSAIQERLDAALLKVTEHYQKVPGIVLDFTREGLPRETHKRLVQRMMDYANHQCDEDDVKRTFQMLVKQSEMQAA